MDRWKAELLNKGRISKFNKKFQILGQKIKVNDKRSLNAYGNSCMASRKYNLTFKQIADFCNLHEVGVQGIADGEVAKIKAYNPIISGQLSREEIELYQRSI